MLKTDLSKFNNSWYNPRASWITRVIWYCINACIINSNCPFNFIKIFFLRMFGAKVGSNVVVKPRVNIKYPWNVSIGDNVWIGERVWLDSLGKINIGSNSCISQGAMLICGNHNYKKSSFDLIVGDIILEDGVWIGTGAIVCAGVTCQSHAVLAAGSVATDILEAYSIYQGNPAAKIKERILSE
ncbi:MAG: colanic acid biosynthesis acetyltransferase WcaF [Bacteroidetes bacterium]|nr:colanic acid biosynthesis acetyltransferase WcaF [Bacteroidota bacterium]